MRETRLGQSLLQMGRPRNRAFPIMKGLVNGLVFAFAIAAAGAASGAEGAQRTPPAYEDVFTGFAFPHALGSFRFRNQVQYPRVAQGYGVNYVERSGATATINVYDLSLRRIEEGTAGAQVQGEFSRIEQELAALVRQGGYRSATRLEAPVLSKAWLQASYELVTADGRRTFVHTFLRGQHGRFVNVRVTVPRDDGLNRLPVFLLEVSRAIGMLAP